MNWLGVTFPITVTEDDIRPFMGNPAGAGEFVMKRVEEAYEAKCASEDQAVLPYMERGVFLQVIDREWQDYLRAMDDLRTGVNLRAYGQRDPLIEYKKEAFGMFESLMTTVKSKVISAEFRSATAARMQRHVMEMQSLQAASSREEKAPNAGSAATAQPHKSAGASGKTVADVFASMMSPAGQRAMVTRPPMPIAGGDNLVGRQTGAVGRNDPCPCGSGKKYKKCCGRDLA